jgi:hypothetical protein
LVLLEAGQTSILTPLQGSSVRVSVIRGGALAFLADGTVASTMLRWYKRPSVKRGIPDEWRKKKLRENMTDLLPENQKPLLVLRAPLSDDGIVSIYFSSQDGRLMGLSEWSHLKLLIEIISKMCVTQQEETARTAAA